MLIQITFLYTTTISQTKQLSEMSGIFMLLYISLVSGLIEYSCISYQLLHSICCNIRSSLVSGKLYTQEKITVKKADDV